MEEKDQRVRQLIDKHTDAQGEDQQWRQQKEGQTIESGELNFEWPTGKCARGNQSRPDKWPVGLVYYALLCAS